jgi:kynurenine 3-monooxygenase
LLEKAVEKILMKQFPGRYISRYALVTFSNVPYTVAMKAGVIQEGMLKKLCAGIDKAEDVDLTAAEQMIDQELAPLLVPYARQLDAVPAH